MTSQNNIKKFNRIYNETYDDILKYIIIKCHNISDVNDIIQEVYLEFWKIINKKNLEESNIKNYLIGIAINKIKKHYTLIQRIKTISLFSKNEQGSELIDSIKDNLNLDSLIIKNDEWSIIWKYLKVKKNQDIPKIFYLYYVLNLSIKNISKELNKSESYVKNNLYRTLKELYSLFGKEGN